mmetsp:Transcript_49427/g.154981  ORF Transcript_49427/g.154981 Transcript_49427/m.154981 type:complete len:91 (+) Transcript_49427:258-530(+)
MWRLRCSSFASASLQLCCCRLISLQGGSIALHKSKISSNRQHGTVGQLSGSVTMRATDYRHQECDQWHLGGTPGLHDWDKGWQAEKVDKS